MPAGIAVEVEDGYATIEFVDKTKRGLGLGVLLQVGGPASIEKLTRPRNLYRVPESVARAAGLLDDDGAWLPVEPPVDVEPHGYDDGLPDSDWSRAALNEYAVSHGIPDAAQLPNKGAVLAAIRNLL